MIRPDFSARPFDVLRILEIHDGDTVKPLLDVGGEFAWFPWLRLKDFSCPELTMKNAAGKTVDNPAGIKARMATMALLHNYIETIWVVTFKIPPDALAKQQERYGESKKSFARYIGDVWLNDEVRLGDELVAQGLAAPGARVG